MGPGSALIHSLVLDRPLHRYLGDGEVAREALRLLVLREWEDGTAPASAPFPAGATVPTPRRAA